MTENNIQDVYLHSTLDSVNIVRELNWFFMHGLLFLHARKAECPAVGKKPAIIIGNDFSIWIGNTSDAHLDVKGELFGFGRGTYEEKIVSNLLSISFVVIALCLTRCQLVPNDGIFLAESKMQS